MDVDFRVAETERGGDAGVVDADAAKAEVASVAGTEATEAAEEVGSEAAATVDIVARVDTAARGVGTVAGVAAGEATPPLMSPTRTPSPASVVAHDYPTK